jgi:hypothetical protein
MELWGGEKRIASKRKRNRRWTQMNTDDSGETRKPKNEKPTQRALRHRGHKGCGAEERITSYGLRIHARKEAASFSDRAEVMREVKPEISASVRVL